MGDFSGEADYKAYAAHEAHVGVIVSQIKPWLAERVAVQFSATDEVDSGIPPAKRAKGSDAPTKIIRFVDADTGAIYYGEPQDGDFRTAIVLRGDPLTGLPLCHTAKTAKIGRLLSPILPPNILCVGLNYMKHWEESAKKRGIALPTRPVIFMKTSNTVNSHGGEIWRPNMAGLF